MRRLPEFCFWYAEIDPRPFMLCLTMASSTLQEFWMRTDVHRELEFVKQKIEVVGVTRAVAQQRRASNAGERQIESPKSPQEQLIKCRNMIMWYRFVE